MYERKIKALKDFELSTAVDVKFFVKGEVATVRFKSRNEYLNLLKYENFVEARPDEVEGKIIPVVEDKVYLEGDEISDKIFLTAEEDVHTTDPVGHEEDVYTTNPDLEYDEEESNNRS